MNILNARTDAPRELDKLMELTRGRRYLIGMHMGIYTGTNDEQAFLASADDVQCQRLREELLQRDSKGWPDQDQSMPATPVMPEPQPQETQAPENTQMQPPQFPRPVIPTTVGPPQQPQMPQQQPMQMPVYPPQQQQQQQMQAPPPMPTMNGMQMQSYQPPQAPQASQPSMPVGLPQMQAPQWQMPGQPQAAPQAPVLPSGRAPAAPPAPHVSGLGDVLTKIAEVQAANQRLLESIHKHSENNGALLNKVLGVLITTAQMQGVPLDSLASAVAHAGNDESVRNFLQALAGGPTQGKA